MDYIADVLIRISFVVYEIYARLAVLFTKAFPRLTEYSTKILAYKWFGVTINGDQPTDIKILKPDKFYSRVAAYLCYGVASGYLNEEWEMDDITGAVVQCIRTKHFRYLLHPLNNVMQLFNLQTSKKAWTVGANHYDIGNDLFEAMLDKNLQYTCGYWRTAQNLDDAQIAKMDLIARKLELKSGMRVLDIGCGFGTLGCYLAKHHGVSVVGCTVSVEQVKYGNTLCEGLPVELRLCDYRDIHEKFDRVVSVGMFEHVGPKNYDTFMAVVDRCLVDDGIFLLQTIGNNNKRYPTWDMWCHKYIFPNSQIPNTIQIAQLARNKFIIEDWHNFGFDYSKTLAAWQENFEKAWPKLQPKYGDRFYRMWKLYLCTAQGVFISRCCQLWQIVMRKDGNENGYMSVR